MINVVGPLYNRPNKVCVCEREGRRGINVNMKVVLGQFLQFVFVRQL